MNTAAFAEAHAAIDEETLPQEAAPLPRAGAIMIQGKEHLVDPKGRYVPLDLVEPVDLLMDEEVRKIVAYAQALSAQVTRFKNHTLGDIAGLQALVAQEHNATLGGKKGNVSLYSFDGLMRVSLKIADIVQYGPELQAAKAKVDECIRNWQGGADPRLVALVETAFQVDHEGQINRSNLLYLTRLKVDDAAWQDAMKAIRKAERPLGTKEYVQIHVRPNTGAAWQHVKIDLAAA